MDKMGLLVKEKNGTRIKRCRERSKRETEVFATSKGTAEAAKIDDGTRTRIKKGLKQIRKAMEEVLGGKGAGAGAAIGRGLIEGNR